MVDEILQHGNGFQESVHELHHPGFPSSKPQIEIIDHGWDPVADSVPIIGGEVVGGEVSVWPSESTLKRNLFYGR